MSVVIPTIYSKSFDIIPFWRYIFDRKKELKQWKKKTTALIPTLFVGT